MVKITSLKKRKDFLHASSEGKSVVVKGLVLQSIASENPENEEIRVGFTVSKKIGGAVQRNRLKRRLRYLAKEVISDFAAPGHDYVLIGRRAALSMSYESLKKDLIAALKDIAKG